MIENPEIQFIRQRHHTGCGPACIGMLIRRDSASDASAYRRARIALSLGASGTPERTDWDDIRGGLRNLGITYADKIMLHRSFEKISGLSFVKAGKQAGDRWHWVIFDGRSGLLYDPLRDGPCRPTKAMRQPRSHLPLYLS